MAAAEVTYAYRLNVPKTIDPGDTIICDGKMYIYVGNKKNQLKVLFQQVTTKQLIRELQRRYDELSAENERLMDD